MSLEPSQPAGGDKRPAFTGRFPILAAETPSDQGAGDRRPTFTASASGPYPMVPFQPPLPMACRSLFQPAAGSQTSTLISESADGASVALTRQNVGRPLNTAGLGWNGPGDGGGVNSPAATICA